MRLLFLFFLSLFIVCNGHAQERDTIQQVKNTEWFIGVDTYSLLSPLSVIGGMKIKSHNVMLSFSHWERSSRFGIYYDHIISREYKILIGLGYHESYLFNKYKQTREEYLDSLIDNNYHLSTIDVAFYPGSRYEVRHQHFFSFSLTKVFKLYQRFFLNIKVLGVYGVNNYYGHREFRPTAGIQLYYKW